MVSYPAFTALVIVATSTWSALATPGLSLKVTGPSSVTTVVDLKLTTTVTNTGDETLKILNDPLSPLSKLPANTFAIKNDKGSIPSFTGIKVKYVPKVAANAGAYTVLAPGGSINVQHDLSGAYNFTSTGEGMYSVEARNLFYVVGNDGKISTLRANADQGHSTRISGKLAATRPALAKRAIFNGCLSSRQTSLVSAASAAQTYAANALSYAQAHTSATSRFTTWFGTYTASRHSTIVSHFSAISSNTFSSFTFDCTCTDSGTYAYVYPDDFGHVYLCGAFWSAPTTGTDSKGGTLIHESSHFNNNGGTDDNAYGQSACKALALSNPTSAVDNADSHEYFAENIPSLA